MVGDPGLLVPLANPTLHRVKKRYTLGILPHVTDKGHWASTHIPASHTIIDIEGGLLPTLNYIASCETLASSSLHGLIIADALGIPNQWTTGAGFLTGGA